MEIEFGEKSITFQKELNSLDLFTIKFVKILNKLNIKYALVSGYVSILFGRSRSSEDIDIIVKKISESEFNTLWDELTKEFECITNHSKSQAYNDYLLQGTAIRFSEVDTYIPNMKFKFARTETEEWCIDNRIQVNLNQNQLFISPLELQISFKLYLGSEKDLEDGKHLFELFKDKLDMNILSDFNKKLKTTDVFNKYIR